MKKSADGMAQGFTGGLFTFACAVLETQGLNRWDEAFL